MPLLPSVNNKCWEVGLGDVMKLVSLRWRHCFAANGFVKLSHRSTSKFSCEKRWIIRSSSFASYSFFTFFVIGFGRFAPQTPISYFKMQFIQFRSHHTATFTQHKRARSRKLCYSCTCAYLVVWGMYKVKWILLCLWRNDLQALPTMKTCYYTG